MQKCQSSIFISDPLQAAHLGRPECLRVTSNQKSAKNKLFLEFFFRRGLFYAKMPN